MVGSSGSSGFFALQYVRFCASPRTYWCYSGRGGCLCDECGDYHNLPVHAHIKFCHYLSPWVNVWSKAWADVQLIVERWRSTATFKDKFIVGAIVVPMTLCAHLVAEVVYMGAKRLILLFQINIIELLENNIEKGVNYYKGRPRPYFKHN